MIIRVQLRRGTAAAWTAANPTLANGEIGLETDSRKLKVGDGATAWNSQGYITSTLDAAAMQDAITAATAETAPADAWVLPVVVAGVLKKCTWANFKAAIKTYADTLYAAAAHTHAYLTQAAADLLYAPVSHAGSAASSAHTGLGSAAASDTTAFATAAQGALAATALQPAGSGAQLTGITPSQVGAVAKSTLTAQSVLVAITAETPAAVALAVNTFLARASTGDLGAKAITDLALSLLDDATAATARGTLSAYRIQTPGAAVEVTGAAVAPAFAGALTVPWTLTGNVTSFAAATGLEDGETGMVLAKVGAFGLPADPPSGAYKGAWTVTGPLVRIIIERIGSTYLWSADSLTVVS